MLVERAGAAPSLREVTPLRRKGDHAEPARPKIGVLIPCYNEEITIADVVRQFRAQLPEADIYVFDNNSSDRTVDEARQAGATVFDERRQGKGYVVQRMFEQVDADVYVMVDGDATYAPGEVHRLIAPILAGEADMVVGSRMHQASSSEFKRLNRFGNRLFLWIINFVFKTRLTDILSGYRAFSRRFVHEIALFGGGFEIETELTIRALGRGYSIVEVPADLRERPEGSHSKIKIVSDGLLILNTILALFRDYKPLTFFGSLGLAFIAAALIPGTLVIVEFLQTGLVPRLPSAVLAVGLTLCGVLLILAGLIVHTIVRRFQELDHGMRVTAREVASRSSRPTVLPMRGR
jgi:glycosyltransferase involved in cell wall biosynthesis